MSAILGSLLGLFGSAVPEIIQLFKDSAQRKHELALADRQTVIAEAATDTEEVKSVHKAFKATGVWIVDCLNGLIRPMLTISFFGLYVWVKYSQYTNNMEFPWKSVPLWSEDDMAIFATIIAFWFGSRGFKRAREK